MLELLEGSQGILATLDDQTKQRSGTDEKFFNAFQKNYEKEKTLVKFLKPAPKFAKKKPVKVVLPFSFELL